MFKAKDVMTTSLLTVKEDTPIFDAMSILVDKNITGLPVTTDDGTLVGVVSEKDMLKLLFDAQATDEPVAKFMTRNVQTFDEDDELISICDCLIENHFRRVPITSEGKLVGLISRRDIIQFIMDLRQKRLENSS